MLRSGGNDMVWRLLYMLITSLQCSQNVTKYIECPCHHTCMCVRACVCVTKIKSLYSIDQKIVSQLHFTSGSWPFPRMKSMFYYISNFWRLSSSVRSVYTCWSIDWKIRPKLYFINAFEKHKYFSFNAINLIEIHGFYRKNLHGFIPTTLLSFLFKSVRFLYTSQSVFFFFAALLIVIWISECVRCVRVYVVCSAILNFMNVYKSELLII